MKGPFLCRPARVAAVRRLTGFQPAPDLSPVQRRAQNRGRGRSVYPGHDARAEAVEQCLLHQRPFAPSPNLLRRAEEHQRRATRSSRVFQRSLCIPAGWNRPCVDGSPLARVFWRHCNAGWCGHVSDLFVRHIAPLAIMPSAYQVPTRSSHSRCWVEMGSPDPAVVRRQMI